MDVKDLLDSGDLWPHQVEAIRTARNYIEQQKGNQGPKPSALLRLPTGTGKSGIMTVLSRCYEDTKNVLILTPSKLIREQLSQDIASGFFETIGVDNDLFVKEVKQFLPSHKVEEWTEEKLADSEWEGDKWDAAETEDIIKQSKRVVLVSTIQALDILRKQYENTYNLVGRHIDLVMFDEGHREPAPEWAISVRGFNKPTILLTATPYRNDHKQFNVEPSHSFRFTHKDAVTDNYIRNVDFIDFEAQGANNFVKRLLKVYKEQIVPRKPSYIDTPRVIIKCEDDNSIKEIVTELQKKDQTVVSRIGKL